MAPADWLNRAVVYGFPARLARSSHPNGDSSLHTEICGNPQAAAGARKIKIILAYLFLMLDTKINKRIIADSYFSRVVKLPNRRLGKAI